MSSYGYQWQRCDGSAANCVSVADATAKAYGVRSVDAGNTLRVVVTAKNLSGSTNVSSSATSLVAGISAPVITHNHAPTISFVALRRSQGRVYARFSLCDDSSKAVTVIEHDAMAGRPRLHPALLRSCRFPLDARPELDAHPALPSCGPLHLVAPRGRQVRRLEPDGEPLDPHLRGATGVNA